MSPVISQQQFNLWKRTANPPYHRLSHYAASLERRGAVNILTHSVSTPYGHTVLRRKRKINQSPIGVCFLLVMLDVEFTFICSNAPRRRGNGCLSHCKPQCLACLWRILPLAGSEHSLTRAQDLCQSWIEEEGNSRAQIEVALQTAV